MEISNLWRKKSFWLTLIFVLAAAVRFYGVFTYPVEPAADAKDYQRLAVGMTEGRGFINEDGTPTAWRPPGYPFFLFAVYEVLGTAPSNAGAVQAVLGALTAMMLAFLGWELFGMNGGLAVGGLAVIHQSFFWLPRVLISENLSLFLLAAALSILLLFLRSEKIWWMFLLGLVFGVSILVRGANLFIVFLLLAGLVVYFRQDKRRIFKIVSTGGLLILGVLLTAAPWMIRNSMVFGRPAGISTQDGMTFYASYYPPQKDGKLIWGNLPGNEDPFVAESEKAGDEIAVSQFLRRATSERLATEPTRVFRLLPSKFISLLVPFDWEWFPHGEGMVRSLNWTYIFLCLLSLFGLWASFRKKIPHFGMIWLIPAAVFIQTAVFYGSPRFRLPAELSLVLLAGLGLLWIAESGKYIFRKSEQISDFQEREN